MIDAKSQKAAMLRGAVEEGRIVPTALEAHQRFAALCSPEELREHIAALPIARAPDRAAGTARAGELTAAERSIIRALGVTERELQIYGAVVGYGIGGVMVTKRGDSIEAP